MYAGTVINRSTRLTTTSMSSCVAAPLISKMDINVQQHDLNWHHLSFSWVTTVCGESQIWTGWRLQGVTGKAVAVNLFCGVFSPVPSFPPLFPYHKAAPLPSPFHSPRGAPFNLAVEFGSVPSGSHTHLLYPLNKIWKLKQMCNFHSSAWQ